MKGGGRGGRRQVRASLCPPYRAACTRRKNWAEHLSYCCLYLDTSIQRDLPNMTQPAEPALKPTIADPARTVFFGIPLKARATAKNWDWCATSTGRWPTASAKLGGSPISRSWCQ